MLEDHPLGPEGPYISVISIRFFVETVLVVLVLVFIHVVVETQILFPLSSSHFLDHSVIHDKLLSLSTLVREKGLIGFFCFLKDSEMLF